MEILARVFIWKIENTYSKKQEVGSMKQQYYWFTFRNAENVVVAVRAYKDYSENRARDQAQRDSYGLNAFRVTRATGGYRCMTWG